MESYRFFAYYEELDNTGKERYQERQRLGRIGLRDDPYVLEDRGIQTVEWANWPRVEYLDIYNFAVENPSGY